MNMNEIPQEEHCKKKNVEMILKNNKWLSTNREYVSEEKLNRRTSA